MRWVTKFKKQRMGALAAAIAVTAWMPTAMALPPEDALPEVREIVHGIKDEIPKAEKITAESDGIKRMNIELSDKRAAVNWNSFNIGSKAEVNFKGPAGGWMVLNRVAEGNPSEIYGKLNGQGGTVFLINPSGITFGGSAQVEVGSLVASTLDISPDDFLSDTKIVTAQGEKGAITVGTAANIKASEGVVALLAKEVHNNGTINAGKTYMAAGNKIQVSYDDKIVVERPTAGGENKITNIGNINNGTGYVLMTAKAAVNLLADTVNTPTIKADKITIDKDGNIALTGDKVLIDGSLIADGTVTTTGTNVLQVNDTAVINAKTWNATGKNVDVVKAVKGNTADANQISNIALSNALANADVNIIASPTEKKYYADINIKDAITKDSGKDTSLTFTAGRNISVDANITSVEDKAGKLNITLNSNNKLNGKSDRDDGASIIKANIATNGGDFITTGTNGTYFGLKADSETSGITRSITTNGGNIRLEGDQVLLATGGEVKLDAGTGSAFIAGKVDSANVYHNENSTTWTSNKNFVSWYEVNALYEKENSTTDKVGDSHLAVITSKLEDAVVSSTIPKKSNASTEAYVGGHVVAVPVDASGAPLGCTVDAEGKIKLSDELANGKLSTVKILTSAPEDKTNVIVKGDSSRGWYKLNGSNTDGSNTYVRFWAWTTGPEKGKIFYVQVGKISNNTLTKLDGIKLGYSNFAPYEPNDDSLNGSEPALAVNYDTYVNGQHGTVLYSQWDDIFENATDRGANNMQNYVVEKELAHTALNINAGETTLGGDIGSDTKLSNLQAVSSSDINVKGSVNVDGKVFLGAKGNVTTEKTVTADGSVEMHAGHNIKSAAIESNDRIRLEAKQNVTVNDTLHSTKDSSTAIKITAQENFINHAAESANALKTDGKHGHWQVYSKAPTEALGELNSDAFAVWGWDGKSSVSGNDNNLYIFKYNPTLTFTADDAAKKYGESLSNTGFAYYNEMDGRYLGNFLDGYNIAFMNRPGMRDANTASAGYPANARVGTYSIDMVNADAATAWGYKIVKNPGVLTVTGDNSGEVTGDNPGEVTGNSPGDVKPQLDPHDTTNVDGSASYTTAPRQAGPGADRVLGLQSAELPFFREENGQTKLYGTYDVSVDPDKVKMEPTAKVLPEPDQPKNQYREYDKELTTKAGTAKFKLTYNGSTFDIYPVDISGKKVLEAGDAAKNVDVESQALFAAFREMGITLDDLDGVYTHFDNRKEVRSFRK